MNDYMPVDRMSLVREVERLREELRISRQSEAEMIAQVDRLLDERSAKLRRKG